MDKEFKKSKHSFAKIWLNHLGNKIYANGKQILGVDGLHSSAYRDYYKYLHPLYPKLKKGVQNVDSTVGDKKNIIEIKYARLKRMGLCIEKVPAEPWMRGRQPMQRYFYIISKDMSNAITETDGVRGTIVYDWVYKAVKLKRKFAGTKEGTFGNGNETPWIYTERHSRSVSDVKHESSNDMLDFFEDSLLGKKRVTEQEDIILKDEALVMELDDGRLLCIERKKTPFRALFCGELGSGKSMGTSSILDQVHHNFSWEEDPPLKINDYCILLNDSNNQFYQKMIKNNNTDFVRKLKRYRLEARPAPSVNLYVGCPNLRMEFEEEDVSYTLVTSFVKFLKKYDYFTDGIAEWRLKGAEKYLHHIYDSGKKFKTVNSIFEYLLGDVEELKAKQLRSMLNKWKSTFTKIYEKKFLDVNTGCSAEWKLVKHDGTEIRANPVIICAEAGLMPVVNTTLAKRFDYFKNIQANFIQELIEYQNNLPQYNRRRLYVGVDEMRTIYEEGMGSSTKASNSKQAIVEIFREGRFNNIGFVGNTQNYYTLHKDMQSHCTHLFMGLSKSHNERKLIKKNFEIDEEEASEIADLDTFEFLAICKQDYPFKVYERDGSHNYESGSFRGKVLPPLSIHLRGEK